MPNLIIPDIMVLLVRDIRTKTERDDLYEEIRTLDAALFRSDPHGLEEILRTRFSQGAADDMRTIFERPEFKNNPKALRLFFQDLTRTLEKLPLLKLTLAFTPTEEMIDRLHRWVQENIGIGILLDINYDGSMLGGARIIFGGKYKEMSLAQMITEALAKEKIMIRQMMV